MSVERRYAMIRVESGDYLLPSNDRTTLWRISRYEDGPSHGLDDWPRDRMVWGVWRFNRPIEKIQPVHVDDWGCWGLVDDGFDTRAEAVEAALLR